MTQLECEQRAGQWKKGENCPGLSADLFFEKTYDVIEGSAHATFNFIASTCSDEVASLWTGQWTWQWDYTNQAGTYTDSASEEFSFTPDAAGNFTINMGLAGGAGTILTGQVNKNQMSVSFMMPGVVQGVSTSGSVLPGAKTNC